MSDHVSRLPWTDEQWALAQRIVQESARKARVASSFLPLVGPLPDSQASVPALGVVYEAIDSRERGEAEQRLEIDDGKTLPLTRIACNVYLRIQQAEDPDLASAKLMLSRAADVIGRLEDAIVFHGQPCADQPPANIDGIPKVYTVRGGGSHDGLLRKAECKVTLTLPKMIDNENGDDENGRNKCGDEVVRAVIDAIQRLERMGHYGPFACVLGHSLYEAANTPSPGSLVLPSDRIVPFLDGGPLRRSSVVPHKQGVVVALAGSPIDLVVASDVHVSYVQLTLEPRYVLRVSERFVLRMKQPDARCLLTAEAPGKQSEGEPEQEPQS
jgi:uncharacterized linocin/CFP29 family protein